LLHRRPASQRAFVFPALGAYVRGDGATAACSTWPLCNDGIAMSGAEAVQLIGPMLRTGSLTREDEFAVRSVLAEAWLLQDGPLVYLGVGLIEEFAKLLALVLVCWGLRHFRIRDGIILGAAVGSGFAAFESSGYAFSALFTPHGLSLFSLVYTEVLRGVLAPLGHGLWTAILGGVLFEGASRRGHLALTGRLFLVYLAVSVLHGLWDSMRGIAIVLTLLTTNSPALTVLLQQGLLPASSAVATWIFVTFEFGGMGIVSMIGLWMLRASWRRARLQPSPV